MLFVFVSGGSKVRSYVIVAGSGQERTFVLAGICKVCFF